MHSLTFHHFIDICISTHVSIHVLCGVQCHDPERAFVSQVYVFVDISLVYFSLPADHGQHLSIAHVHVPHMAVEYLTVPI